MLVFGAYRIIMRWATVFKLQITNRDMRACLNMANFSLVLNGKNRRFLKNGLTRHHCSDKTNDLFLHDENV